jgi:tetratricopeptide (TPR) repeat protein
MTATAPSVLQNLLKQAIVAHLQGQLGSAESLYRSVLDEDQSNPVLYANLGTLCLATGRYQEAIELLEQALKLKPDYPLAYNSLGIAWQQQKDWQQALECYQKALALQENYPDAWNNVGNLFHQWERYADAVRAFERALQHKSDYPEAWFNMGNSLQALNRPGEAMAAYRAVLKLKPQSHLALNNLGILLQQRGNLIQAEQCYRQAMEFCPDFLEAQSNLAQVLTQSQQMEAAIDTYQKLILALENRQYEFWGTPLYLNTLNQLGLLLEESGQYQAAIDRYRQAIEQQLLLDQPSPQLSNSQSSSPPVPNPPTPTETPTPTPNPELSYRYYNLGNVLQKTGDFAGAIEAYTQGVTYGADFAEGWNNLGNALKQVGNLPGAIEAFEKALALKPQDANTWTNAGSVYHRLGNLDQASDYYHRALILQPDHGDAQFNLSLLLLGAGQFHSGWWGYEYRFRKQNPIPLNPPPGVDRWDESFDHPALNGGTLLLVAEQGFGDTLQFIRYGALLKQRGIQSLAVVVPPRLVAIVSTCSGYDRILPIGSELPEDLPQPYAWFPLLSVPRICGTHLNSIPAASPYLFASPDRVKTWESRLQSLPGLKIGLCWQGNENTEQENLQGRSCPLAVLEPLLQLPGVSFISLQKGVGEQTLDQCAFGDRLYHFGDLLDGGDQAFVDTAAIVSQVDLVITTDTSVAHLAAALGQQTWILLHHLADWRWLQARSDSPWYPTVRLFRQSEAGNWQTVITETIEALITTFKLSTPLALPNSLPTSNALPTSLAPELPTELPEVSSIAQDSVVSPRILVSVGELLDKISILQIKVQQLQQSHAHSPQSQWVTQQLVALNQELDRLDLPPSSLETDLTELKKVNQRLWKLENQIRVLMKAKTKEEAWADQMAKVAQAICRYNDRRAFLKRKISEVYQSQVNEVKVYTKTASGGGRGIP